MRHHLQHFVPIALLGSLTSAMPLGAATHHPLSARAVSPFAALRPSVKAPKERVLYVFQSGSDGANPQGLIADMSGALYGTTQDGGGSGCFGSGCGTAFKLAPKGAGYTESILYHFAGREHKDGWFPNGGLIADSGGALYGTTVFGGDYRCMQSAPGCGTAFKLTPAGPGYTEGVLHRFRGRGSMDGASPNAGLIADATGALYGTTLRGGSASRVGGTWTFEVRAYAARPARRPGSSPGYSSLVSTHCARRRITSAAFTSA